MNTKAFLKDWQPGDIVTAADMQALADTVAMLEADADTRGGAERGASRRVSDGPQGWPWQVVALHGEDKYELRVVPGNVLAGIRLAEPGEGLGEQLGELEVAYTYLELPATEGADVVQDYDGTKDVATVYLELTGRVVRRYLTWRDMVEEGLMDDPYGMMTEEDKERKTGHEIVTLEDARLRVTCAPVDTALRIWPLAVVTKAHAQPVTQLQWGDLSALECRGIARTDGKPVWPSDRSGAAAWGTTAHADGMDAVAALEFSTAVERIEGTLRACMDEDGALEFYLGQYEAGGSDSSDTPGQYEPGGEDPWTDEPGGDTPDDDVTPPGPYNPPGPGPTPGPTPGPSVTKVKYGYIAGEGFLRCDLVKAADDQLYWELELDPGFLAQACAAMAVPVTVGYRAGGTQQGSTATVEMGLGECAASTTGMLLRGTAQLVFHGTNSVDASKKSATVKVNYEASPVWTQERIWYLSPKVIHKAGAYVKLEKANNGWQPGGFVEASAWYKFSIKKEAFRKNALAYLKAEMAAISVDGEAESTSVDSSVRAVLSGTLTAPVYTMTLGDATE